MIIYYTYDNTASGSLDPTRRVLNAQDEWPSLEAFHAACKASHRLYEYRIVPESCMRRLFGPNPYIYIMKNRFMKLSDLKIKKENK
jgi:hypothetical protein